MKGLSLILLTAFAAVGLASCGAPATNGNAANVHATNANATSQTERPTVEGLKAIEPRRSRPIRTRTESSSMDF